MVSEKVVVVLIIIAILLSVVSVVVTVSTVNTKMIPKIQTQETVIPDNDKGQVSIIINPQAEGGK